MDSKKGDAGSSHVKKATGKSRAAESGLGLIGTSAINAHDNKGMKDLIMLWQPQHIKTCPKVRIHEPASRPPPSVLQSHVI